MVPTPLAQNLIGPLHHAVELLRVSVQERSSYDRQQANETCFMSMTDLPQAVILPPLVQRFPCRAHSVDIGG
ncbi:LysR family transcriptional regulator, partial [Pseudomonas aeruginosa]